MLLTQLFLNKSNGAKIKFPDFAFLLNPSDVNKNISAKNYAAEKQVRLKLMSCINDAECVN